MFAAGSQRNGQRSLALSERYIVQIFSTGDSLASFDDILDGAEKPYRLTMYVVAVSLCT